MNLRWQVHACKLQWCSLDYIQAVFAKLFFKKQLDLIQSGILIHQHVTQGLLDHQDFPSLTAKPSFTVASTSAAAHGFMVCHQLTSNDICCMLCEVWSVAKTQIIKYIAGFEGPAQSSSALAIVWKIVRSCKVHPRCARTKSPQTREKKWT